MALGADHVFELGAENFADGTVKIHRLGHAHAMHLGAHDEQAGAGEKVDDIAGASGGETKIIRFDEHERALAGFAGLIGNDLFQHAAVLVGMARPQFELRLGFFRPGRGEHRRFKVTNLPVVIRDQVAVSVTNGFSHAPLRTEVADDGTNLSHGVIAAEQKRHHPPPPSGLGVGREILDDVLAKQFLDSPVLRVMGGDDGFGILLYQLGAGREHAHGRQIQTRPRNQPG